MDRLGSKVVAFVVDIHQIADCVFAAPRLQFAVVERHRLRSGSATFLAVAARSLNY